MNLTPKQIQALRIAVSEVAGECQHHPSLWERRGTDGDSDLFCTVCQGFLDTVKPSRNYPEDLNAVRAIEIAMSPTEKISELSFLEKLVEEEEGSSLFIASALHRCMAILMVKAPDKWEEIQNLKD